MKPATVRVTRHFARNLDDIRSFLEDAGDEEVFPRLLDDLFDETIPSLERFPDLGSDFFRRRPASREAAELAAVLQQRLGERATLRELIRGDYLVLYARRNRDIYLLTIKHHRQLSFDFPQFWQPE